MLKNLLNTTSIMLKITSKREIQKTAEVTCDFIGNKSADKITKVPRNSPQNSLKTVESETENTGFAREIPKKGYISPEKRQQIINDLRSNDVQVKVMCS